MKKITLFLITLFISINSLLAEVGGTDRFKFVTPCDIMGSKAICCYQPGRLVCKGSSPIIIKSGGNNYNLEENNIVYDIVKENIKNGKDVSILKFDNCVVYVKHAELMKEEDFCDEEGCGTVKERLDIMYIVDMNE